MYAFSCWTMGHYALYMYMYYAIARNSYVIHCASLPWLCNNNHAPLSCMSYLQQYAVGMWLSLVCIASLYWAAFVIDIFSLTLRKYLWCQVAHQPFSGSTISDSLPPNFVQRMSMPCPCHAACYPMGFSQTLQLCYLCRHALQGLSYHSYMWLYAYKKIYMYGYTSFGYIHPGYSHPHVVLLDF